MRTHEERRIAARERRRERQRSSAPQADEDQGLQNDNHVSTSYPPPTSTTERQDVAEASATAVACPAAVKRDDSLRKAIDESPSIEIHFFPDPDVHESDDGDANDTDENSQKDEEDFTPRDGQPSTTSLIEEPQDTPIPSFLPEDGDQDSTNHQRPHHPEEEDDDDPQQQQEQDVDAFAARVLSGNSETVPLQIPRISSKQAESIVSSMDGSQRSTLDALPGAHPFGPPSTTRRDAFDRENTIIVGSMRRYLSGLIAAELVGEAEKEAQEELARYRGMEEAEALEVRTVDEEHNDDDDSADDEKLYSQKRIYALMAIAGVLVVLVLGVIVGVFAVRGSSPSPSDKDETDDDLSEIPGSTGTALIILDVQDCFMELSVSSTGLPGTLEVPDTASLIPVLNTLRTDSGCMFDIVVRSNDFHPKMHISFASTHGLPPFAHAPIEAGGLGKGGLPISCLDSANPSCCPSYWLNPNASNCDIVLCPNRTAMTDEAMAHVLKSPACTICKDSPERCFSTQQFMWPDHCVQYEEAGGMPPTLMTDDNDIVEEKGDLDYVDSYSSFWDNTRRIQTTLDQTLRDNLIQNVYITGIATDFAVVLTASHAIGLKYNTTVIIDATRGITQEGTTKAILQMQEEGANIITSDDVSLKQCPSST